MTLSDESPYLHELILLLRSKSRPLRFRFSTVQLNEGFDDKHSMPFGELEFSLSPLRTSFRVKIKIWSDRWTFVSAWRDRPGNPRWTESYQGRLSGEIQPSQIYKLIIGYAEQLEEGTLEIHHATWKKLLRRGPERSLLRE